MVNYTPTTGLVCFSDLIDHISTALDASHTAQENNQTADYKTAGNKIRMAVEVMCTAVLFQRSVSNPATEKGNKPLDALVKHIRDTNTLKFYTNANANYDTNTSRTDPSSENVKIAGYFLDLKVLGNGGSHYNAELNNRSDFDGDYGLFVKVVQWYYNAFPTIPQTIIDKLNRQPHRAALAVYLSKIKGLFNEQILTNESIKLSQVYIQPKVDFWKKSLRQPRQRQNDYSPCEAFPLLENFIHPFLVEAKDTTYTDTFKQEKARLFLLFGQPGQGKTSFCRWLLHKCITQGIVDNPVQAFADGKGVVYVRLRDIGNSRDLFNNPLEELHKHINSEICPDNAHLSNTNLQKSLLILDGLDELAMQENTNKNALEKFCRDLIEKLDRYPQMRIVLTSRHSYADLQRFHDNDAILIACLGLLNEVQQINWLQQYKTYAPACPLSEENIRTINRDEKHKHLKELINQPILLQIVTETGLDLGATSRAAIYDKLFDTLTQRSWADKQIKSLEGLDTETLREVMREIAFEIYKSEYEHIRSSDMEKLNSVKIFRKKLGASEEEAVFKRLMIAFYMQETPDKAEKKERETAIEFMHKSLQEYLSAEYFWETLKTLTYTVLGSKKSTNSFNIPNAEIFSFFWDLFSHKEMSEEIERYLAEVIANDPDATQRDTIFSRMVESAEVLLLREFLPEKEPIKGLRQPLWVFRAYWHILASLKPNECTIKENWVGAFIFAFKMHQAQTDKSTKWCLPKAELKNANLEEVNLRRANLREANLEEVNLCRANLEEANLIRANLIGASLDEADLIGANLRGANLQKTYWMRAHLQGADLQGANLEGASLFVANLQRADLYEANLQRAYLEGADLQNANLYGVYLFGANLRSVNLQGADLEEANLQEADLQGANLRGAENLTFEQLCAVESLYQAKIDEPLLQQIKDSEYAHLLEAPKIEDDGLPF